MLYAEDAGIASESAEGLAKIMTIILTVFKAAGLTVSEKKTETMLLRTPNQVLPTSPLVVEAAGQRYMQTMQFLYLGSLIGPNTDHRARDQTNDPTRVGMLRSFQVRAVWYRGRPVHVRCAC